MRPCLKASLVAAGKSDSKFGLRSDSARVWKLRFLIKTLWALLDVIQFVLLFFQSSHNDCFTVSCFKTCEFFSVTLLVARKALLSSVRTQFFGTTSFSALMNLIGNLGNSCVVNGGMDSSGIFFIILVVNPTGFRWKDKEGWTNLKHAITCIYFLLITFRWHAINAWYFIVSFCQSFF